MRSVCQQLAPNLSSAPEAVKTNVQRWDDAHQPYRQPESLPKFHRLRVVRISGRQILRNWTKDSAPNVWFIRLKMKLLSHAVPATFLFRLALAQVSDQPTCYFANGTALPNRPGYLQYQACNGSSICCGLNRSNPPNGDRADGFTMDECLPNGLCQNRRTEDGIGKVSYVRCLFSKTCQ